MHAPILTVLHGQRSPALAQVKDLLLKIESLVTDIVSKCALIDSRGGVAVVPASGRVVVRCLRSRSQSPSSFSESVVLDCTSCVYDNIECVKTVQQESAGTDFENVGLPAVKAPQSCRRVLVVEIVMSTQAGELSERNDRQGDRDDLSRIHLPTQQIVAILVIAN
jgi:hypothetical protein